MMLDHSEAASIFDICECKRCTENRKQFEGRHCINDYYFFTIRSKCIHALKKHRHDMMEFGWDVGPIKLESSGILAGKFTFTASIPKVAVSKEEFEQLAQWDRDQGEV